MPCIQLSIHSACMAWMESCMHGMDEASACMAWMESACMAWMEFCMHGWSPTCMAWIESCMHGMDGAPCMQNSIHAMHVGLHPCMQNSIHAMHAELHPCHACRTRTTQLHHHQFKFATNCGCTFYIQSPIRSNGSCCCSFSGQQLQQQLIGQQLHNPSFCIFSINAEAAATSPSNGFSRNLMLYQSRNRLKLQKLAA